ncbi:MAG: hypothetical protein DWQ40_00400 [Actinobacteria bacterium]|nr:MAG: hypothetical protein DWQ40_00400 [Actinomycetota bacterium]REK35570.1 MAG: hypothetical protein DWQ20_05985 [Actinomycetota bacterium]
MARVARVEEIGGEDLDKWRGNLPKGNQRVVLHEGTSELPEVDKDDKGHATLPTKRQGPIQIADPRKVRESMEADLAMWVRSDPHAMMLMRAIMRNKPEGQHLTNDELDAKIEEWLREAGRTATENAYKHQGYDKGTNLDVQDKGIWLPSQR